MKSQWFGCKHRKEFGKLLDESNRGQSLWSTFADFLTLASCALMQGAYKLRTGQINAAIEEEYMRCVESYGEKAKFMAQAMAVVTNALEERRYDFLGTFAGEAEILNEWNGQFFTPDVLCKALARMSLGEAKPDPENRLTIAEPCVGAGAIAIAVATDLQERGFGPRDYWLDCGDIDHRMFQAAYIQLTLCGVPAVVRRCNSLYVTPQPGDRAELTFVGALYPFRLTPKQIEEREQQAKAQAEREQREKEEAARRQREAELEKRIRKNKGQTEFDLAI